jgi:hypothetical protein
VVQIALRCAMARATGAEIDMRIVIAAPVPGVAHSLQKDDAPFDVKVATEGAALQFDFPVRVAPGPRFLGPFVRSEGKERRFVYVRIGELAGQPQSPWSRRMKIDIHDIAAPLIEAALAGQRLEVTIGGTLPDGSPACATIKDRVWRAVAR